jgi:ketosteroid isomerase-like protein
MTDADVQDFITRFAAAWAARDGDAFLALWHADGTLHYPMTNRVLNGSELGRLNDIQKQQAPDLVWQLLDWTSRGDTIIIEWQTNRFVNGKSFAFRGVDKLKLRDGKIVEERVYTDTAPLHALREGKTLEPLVVVPAA